MRMSRGEKIGFAIMFAGMPITVYCGPCGVAVAVLGAAVLLIAQRINLG